jgi:hypothetical protein
MSIPPPFFLKRLIILPSLSERRQQSVGLVWDSQGHHNLLDQKIRCTISTELPKAVSHKEFQFAYGTREVKCLNSHFKCASSVCPHDHRVFEKVCLRGAG